MSPAKGNECHQFQKSRQRGLRLFMLIALVVATAAAPAVADRSILCECSNFSGCNIPVGRNMANPDHPGFGDRASSAYVLAGTGQISATRP